MIKWIIGILITFIGIIAIPLYFHFLDKPELKYTISSPMTIDTNEGEQNWQLITVNNTGNKEAKSIKIKINSNILDYKIIPFLQTDKYEVKQSPKTLDIEYMSLPPQGTIEIKISLPIDERISDQNINIVHESGIASKATSKDKMIAFLLLVFWIIIFIATIMMPIIASILYCLYQLRVDACDEYRALSVLKRKKPFFLSNENWKTIRGNALENAFHESHYIQDRYRAFLNEDKPDYLSHEEYEQLIVLVSTKYANTFWDEGYIFGSDVTERLINNYKTKHPKNLTVKSEKDIDKEAVRLFIQSFFDTIHLVSDPKYIESQYYQIEQSILPDNVKEIIIHIV